MAICKFASKQQLTGITGFTFFILTSTAGLGADASSLLYYLDGAREQLDVSVVKGYVEVPLPDQILPKSIRVSPQGVASLVRVSTVPAASLPAYQKEVSRLNTRKSFLQDRLKALVIREEVFIGAAKNQSGKTLRKTKTNSDPLTDIRQGTEFAFEKLEEVYRLRRSTETELRQTESILTKSGKDILKNFLDISKHKEKS